MTGRTDLELREHRELHPLTGRRGGNERMSAHFAQSGMAGGAGATLCAYAGWQLLRTQSERVGGSLSAYAEETRHWGGILSALPTETGAALLDKSLQSVESWNAAWEYNYNDVIDDSWAESVRNIRDFDDIKAPSGWGGSRKWAGRSNALIAWQ